MNKNPSEDRIVLENADFFDPYVTLDCGQTFRWARTPLGTMHGTAGGRSVDIRTEGGSVIISGDVKDGDEVFWRRYLDLDTPYKEICALFLEDSELAAAVKTYPGIRIVRQDPWEALCSFIISQNNNIPRIKGIIERLCTLYGDRTPSGGYSFPEPEKLASLEEEDLAEIRAGFRNKYIIDAARKTVSGEVSFGLIENGSTPEGEAELMKIKGVGPKVAMCVLLYGFGKYDAFPVDVWVKRIMAETYPDGLPSCVKGYEGIAQQYLFHYRRNK